MNIQRFIRPGSIAAAIHAALLVAYPPSQPPAAAASPPPVVRLDPLVPPPQDPAEAQPVKSLLGGAPRPDLPDVSSLENDAVVTIAPVLSVPHPIDGLEIRPPGMPGGVGIGEWTPPSTPFVPSDQLDRIPGARVQVAPDYPVALQQEGVSGTVLVELNVDASGCVTGARALQSTRREFEAPTLRAVLKWRFEGGRKNGRPVPFRIIVPVNFQLAEL
jgi:protein TonB